MVKRWYVFCELTFIFFLIREETNSLDLEFIVIIVALICPWFVCLSIFYVKMYNISWASLD